MKKVSMTGKINRDIIVQIGISILLFIIYYMHNEYTPGCWEMPDEGGYLFNAALFTNANWTEVFSNGVSYYGYGYSIFMIPLFLFCRSGEAVLNGVIVMNILFVVASYNIWVAVFKKIFPQCHRGLLFVGSAVLCIFPGIFSLTFKVFAESLIYLLFSLIVLVLLEVADTDKLGYSIFLGLISVFLFFVHTRCIVVVGVVGITMVGLLICRKISKKTFLGYLGAMLVLYCIMYYVKGIILSVLGTGRLIAGQTQEINNVITGNFITDRIVWIFADNNWIKYILAFTSKMFYAITASAGTFLLGLVYCVRNICKGLKKKVYDVETVGCFFFVTNIGLMVLALTFLGVGDDWAYVFYGRYYEFLILPFVFIGVKALFEKFFEKEDFIKMINIYLYLGAGTIVLQEIHVANNGIEEDTNRLTGISFELVQADNNAEALFFCIMLTIICLLMYLLTQRIKKVSCLVVILATVAGVFCLNNNENIEKNNETNALLQSDIQIANIITSNIQENQEIYFVYEDYRYDIYYQRMQIFLKEYPMHVIWPEEYGIVQEGDFVITYRNKKVAEQLLKDYGTEYLYEGRHYQLFVK